MILWNVHHKLWYFIFSIFSSKLHCLWRAALSYLYRYSKFKAEMIYHRLPHLVSPQTVHFTSVCGAPARLIIPTENYALYVLIMFFNSFIKDYQVSTNFSLEHRADDFLFKRGSVRTVFETVRVMLQQNTIEHVEMDWKVLVKLK